MNSFELNEICRDNLRRAGETAERGEISDRQSAWNDYRACIEIGVRGL